MRLSFTSLIPLAGPGYVCCLPCSHQINFPIFPLVLFNLFCLDFNISFKILKVGFFKEIEDMYLNLKYLAMF